MLVACACQVAAHLSHILVTDWTRLVIWCCDSCVAVLVLSTGCKALESDSGGALRKTDRLVT